MATNDLSHLEPQCTGLWVHLRVAGQTVLLCEACGAHHAGTPERILFAAREAEATSAAPSERPFQDESGDSFRVFEAPFQGKQDGSYARLKAIVFERVDGAWSSSVPVYVRVRLAELSDEDLAELFEQALGRWWARQQ